MHAYIAGAVLAATSLVAAAPVVASPVDVEKRQSDDFCINFTSDITWYYEFADGPWGSGGAEGPSDGTVCVPYTTVAQGGGGMYIGPAGNPDSNSTKLECLFQTTQSGNMSNCDVSLVNGYSLSVNCTTAAVPNAIGGSVDLFSYINSTSGVANSCANYVGDDCINENGPTATSQDQINGFFQPATYNGNNYCLWSDCAQVGYAFPASDGITCVVSGSDSYDGVN